MALKHYKKKVAYILENYENARNNDGSLYAYFIKTYCPDLVLEDKVHLKDFKNLPSYESVRRSRQIIQNDNGRFLPTDTMVIKERNIKQSNWTNSEVREAQSL